VPCEPDPLDTFVKDLRAMVVDNAPRLFAVVQEYGERVDGRIVAWGMAFDDHAEIVSCDRSMRTSAKAPEQALFLFRVPPHIRPHLVWVTPEVS